MIERNLILITNCIAIGILIFILFEPEMSVFCFLALLIIYRVQYNHTEYKKLKEQYNEKNKLKKPE